MEHVACLVLGVWGVGSVYLAMRTPKQTVVQEDTLQEEQKKSTLGEIVLTLVDRTVADAKFVGPDQIGAGDYHVEHGGSFNYKGYKIRIMASTETGAVVENDA